MIDLTTHYMVICNFPKIYMIRLLCITLCNVSYLYDVFFFFFVLYMIIEFFFFLDKDYLLFYYRKISMYSIFLPFMLLQNVAVF